MTSPETPEERARRVAHELLGRNAISGNTCNGHAVVLQEICDCLTAYVLESEREKEALTAEREKLRGAVEGEVKAHAASLAASIAYERRAVRAEDERDAALRDLAAARAELDVALVHEREYRAVSLDMEQRWKTAERDLSTLKERTFPVLQAPPGAPTRVPWPFLAPFEGNAKRNHDQDLEKLASRGGLGVAEMIAVVEGKRLREMDRDEVALPRLLAALQAFEEKRNGVELLRASNAELRGLLREAKRGWQSGVLDFHAFFERPDVIAACKEPGT